MDDEVDIYGDLDDFDEEKFEITPEAVKELQEENAELQRKIEELSDELDRITKYSKSLETNISSLHKTAKLEISRKDRMISDLRQELDNSAFRRNNNFRIPKITPTPSVISLPPKDEWTCTEVKKEEVNDTIKKEETEYRSPLINEDEADDEEYMYQSEKIPVTLFGARLKKRLEQESREEAEALRRAQEEKTQIPDLDKATGDVDVLKNKEDKGNEYRLIPLDLQKLSENVRKRGWESLERSDDSKSSEKQDYHKSRENYESKRRKLEESESRWKNSGDKSASNKRLETEAEYCCPGEIIKDEPHTKRHYDDRSDSHGSSRHQKTGSGSRSRSKSRERRDRREEWRDARSLLDRRKESRGRSRSPRGHDSEKGKYPISRKAIDNRYENSRRENPRNFKRLIRKHVSPVRKVKLRLGIGRRNNDRLDRNIQDKSKFKNEGRREFRLVERIDRSRRFREVPKNTRVNRRNINKIMIDSRQRDRMREEYMRQKPRSKSKSPSPERIKRNSEERTSIEEDKPLEIMIKEENKLQDDSDGMEEGEIPDSPTHDFPNVTSSSRIEKIKMSPRGDQRRSTDNEGSYNLDDSLKEEKIENIELFIEKLQSNDQDFFQKTRRRKDEELKLLSGNLRSKSEIMCDSKKNDIKDGKGRVAMTGKVSEKDTSNESVHLTSILGDSSDEDNGKSVLNSKVNDVSNNQVDTKLPNPIPVNDSSSPVNSGTDNTEKISENAPEDVKSNERKSPGVSPVREETPDENIKIEDPPKSCAKSSQVLQSPRVILQEIGSVSKTAKSNESQPQRSTPREKENSVKSSDVKTDKIIVVARRRKIRLTDSSTSMTVVASEHNTDENQ